MNMLLHILSLASPWAFLVLCVFSYFSGMLLALMVRAIKRVSWERAPWLLKLGYQVVRAFREYVTKVPVEQQFVLP